MKFARIVVDVRVWTAIFRRRLPPRTEKNALAKESRIISYTTLHSQRPHPVIAIRNVQQITLMAIDQQLPKIKLVRIAHVYYTHSDLNLARRVLLDLGSQVAEDRGDSIYFKGYGTEPLVHCAPRASPTPLAAQDLLLSL